LGCFEIELVKAIDGGGAELRGMKIEEWKIDEHRVMVAVIFDWFGWLEIPTKFLSSALVY
jgi:hypothetical protein